MKKSAKKEVTQPKKHTFNGKLAKLVDGSVYWLVLTGLAVLAVSGVKFYLQPVDEVLSNVFAFSLVGMALYVALRNR